MAGRLAGKVAIITGGAGGIGAATGLLFCEQGARVVLVDSEAPSMQAALSAIRAAVPAAELLPIVADVGREETAAHVVTEATKAFGALDVLVNLAGIRAYEPLAEASAATWDALLKVNLLSYAYLIRESLGALRACGRGSIINVASTHAVNPRAGMGQYDVTKAGIVSLTRTLAFEEARHGIRVNAVCPGPVDTRMIHALEEQLAPGNPASVGERYQAAIPSGRYTTPEEIASMVLFLCSDLASNTTGGQFVVDGGRTSTGGAVTNLVAR